MLFTFENNLINDKNTYAKLIALYHILNSSHHEEIILDFSKVTFLSANLLAVLGCCVDNTMFKRNHKIALRGLNPKIKTIMQKNGFNKYFTWEHLNDALHHTMSYEIFQSTTEHLVDFERYLVLNIFSRYNLPAMNTAYKNCIIDNLLEMFNNVIDHANSEYVYVCGQYFPQNLNLCFSIVDLGKTIHENVSTYLKNKTLAFPDNSLEWAILPGNSTKTSEAPGGLGFSTLLSFLKLNNGYFTLISDKELYELQPEQESFSSLASPFPGTIVTITINLTDNQLYIFDENNNNLIVF
ncbi:MAG: hypothetical protein HFH79_01285 [Lachnospiraceae bacterium]|nr:hypothetical protein [Lachnospiraceae bacterium]